MPYAFDKHVKGSIKWWKWDLEYKLFFFFSPSVDSEETW